MSKNEQLDPYVLLQNTNNELTSLLTRYANSPIELAKTKREIHKNKVKMYDLILQEDKVRVGSNARDFLANVKAMPKMVKHGTGIEALDYQLDGGFATGIFIQLAGESGVGKTTLLLDIICNCSEGYKSAFFNFEMGDRLLANKLNKKKLSEKQLTNLWINSDTRNLDDLVMEIELLNKDGYKFFVIDSKMKIEVSGNEPTHEKISRLSNTLSKLTQQRDIIIMLINQISEEDLKGKRLSMKGSGDQKYDADIALFYVKDKDNKRKLICSKNRQDEKTFEIELIIGNDGVTRGVGDSEIPIIREYQSDNSFLNGVI